MKKLLIVYSLIGSGVIAAYIHTKESKLIDRYHQVDTICRGSDLNQKSTLTACLERDMLTKKLLKHGLCWGQEHQAEYQKEWLLCDKPVDFFSK